MQIKVSKERFRNHVERTEHVQNLIKTIQQAKPISKEKESELFAEYIRTKDPKIKDTIVKSHMRFAFSVAKSFSKDPEEILDMTMEGMMGIVEAVDKFDPSQGYRFLSFASFYVSKYIMEYSHDSRIVRRSKDSVLRYKVSVVKENFFAINGRYPDEYEIIDIIRRKYGIDVKKTDYIRDIVVSSMDSSLRLSNGDEETTMEENPTFASKDGCHNTNAVIDKMNAEDINTRVNNALSVLNKRDREIMKKLFGIGEFHEYSPDQVAEEYGMSTARINQIRNKSLERMRKSSYALAV